MFRLFTVALSLAGRSYMAARPTSLSAARADRAAVANCSAKANALHRLAFRQQGARGLFAAEPSLTLALRDHRLAVIFLARQMINALA